jgi:hypothetical protein
VTRPRNWSREAERKTAREAARVPLLAAMGAARTWTADDLRERHERIQAEVKRWHEEMVAMFTARALLLRTEVQDILATRYGSYFLTHPDMDVLQAYRDRLLPPTPEYCCDFWREVRDRLRAGGPAIEKHQHPRPPHAPGPVGTTAPRGDVGTEPSAPVGSVGTDPTVPSAAPGSMG